MYPPQTTADDFRRVPQRFRSDAVQEAWAAHLEGRNPRRAVHRYVKAARRLEQREVPASQLPPESAIARPHTPRGMVDLASLGSDLHAFIESEA